MLIATETETNPSNSVMNRFCFYLWIFEQAHADKTRSAFDKSQTTDIVAVYIAIL
jgi:hypothetical protein